MSDMRSITVRTLPDGVVRRFTGRDAWALHALIDAGDRGCTPIDHPGPRWSGFAWPRASSPDADRLIDLQPTGGI